MSLSLNLRTLLGAAIGVIAGLISVVLGRGPENAPLMVIAVLTIALVGFGLGAGPALFAYITASTMIATMLESIPTAICCCISAMERYTFVYGR